MHRRRSTLAWAGSSLLLADLLSRIERLPETREFYERIGAQVMQGGPQEMRAFQATEIQLWKRIAAQAKVELQ